MPDLTLLWNAILGNAGALAIAVIVIILTIRGELIPGFIYRAQEKRLNAALEANAAVALSMDRLTDEIRSRGHG